MDQRGKATVRGKFPYLAPTTGLRTVLILACFTLGKGGIELKGTWWSKKIMVDFFLYCEKVWLACLINQFQLLIIMDSQKYEKINV